MGNAPIPPLSDRSGKDEAFDSQWLQWLEWLDRFVARSREDDDDD